MCKIAIFGGTFNPIHNGHINFIKQAHEQLNLVKVIVVPAYISPFKTAANDIVSSQHRMNMCRIACADLPYVTLSDYEINKGGVSYTYDTVMNFYYEESGMRNALLLGSDQLAMFTKWYKWKEILEHAVIVTMARSESDAEQIQRNVSKISEFGEIIVLKSNICEISSTEIRKNSITTCNLNENVVQYIHANRLYGI